MDKLAYEIRRMWQVPLTGDVATQYGIQVTLTFVSIVCPAMLFVEVWEKFKQRKVIPGITLLGSYPKKIYVLK